MSEGEASAGQEEPAVVSITETEVAVLRRDPNKGHDLSWENYDFDQCWGSWSTQEQVFKDSAELMTSVLDGYNVCIFAYGQSGSGKTHTLFGSAGWAESAAGWASGGIIPRCVAALFDALPKDATVFASFMQIYR